MKTARAFAILAATVALCLQARAASRPPLPLANVTLSRVAGGWYIIATIPNSFERGMVTPYDIYTPSAGGKIREDFFTRRHSFSAPVKHFTVHDWARPGTHNAHWRVQLLWPFSVPFLVLYTDPQYRYLLFGEENRSLGWIYSRTPTVPDTDYHTLLRHFAALGYDPSKFRKFIQKPDQIGKPGFWSDAIQPAKTSPRE
jgi:apolipoprotein D and lipocalin family protein